jgi:parvulin-like peptidyl-prolyl isomerase
MGGFIERGALRDHEVEEAVFKLQPGEVSDIIQDNGDFFVAKLEEKRIGTVRPFEDPKVQDEIRETLRREQFRTMREQIQEELKKNALVQGNDQMMNTALEMAMQRYSVWHTAGDAATPSS